MWRNMRAVQFYAAPDARKNLLAPHSAHITQLGSLIGSYPAWWNSVREAMGQSRLEPGASSSQKVSTQINVRRLRRRTTLVQPSHTVHARSSLDPAINRRTGPSSHDSNAISDEYAPHGTSTAARLVRRSLCLVWDGMVLLLASPFFLVWFAWRGACRVWSAQTRK